MPQTFYAHGELVHLGADGEPHVVYTMPLGSEFTCRDSFLNKFKTNLATRIQSRCSSSYGKEWSAIYYGWTRGHAVDLRLKLCSFSSNFPRLEEFHIPHTIERLRRKFPAITFTPIRGESDGFSSVSRFGARIEGDASALEAFYWFTLIIRAAQYDVNSGAREDRPWKDVNKLLERTLSGNTQVWSWNGDRVNHTAAWDILRNEGPLVDPWRMLIYGGPLTTRVSTVFAAYEREWMDIPEPSRARIEGTNL